ncbi:hypothetical protein GT748_09945 [Bittarella massiliensis]|uniref:Uncharacterized protein n=1 Tax=Bittarella massiliensis (ex Durand et al. 2017) TaxID=1720313 RepID=A0ABW9WYQ1_9FIRM|nr:hypothetical protein [Bittarella massiliensis (ex Durand et al. 2017)]MZL80946.1 hypothetical protein [Bittarella massiliensis (ex Durand et al. 2017)]
MYLLFRYISRIFAAAAQTPGRTSGAPRKRRGHK